MRINKKIKRFARKCYCIYSLFCWSQNIINKEALYINTEIIEAQAAEIVRLRTALLGCLIASKKNDPVDYAASLSFIHQETHTALYGDSVEFEYIHRPLAGYYRKEVRL